MDIVSKSLLAFYFFNLFFLFLYYFEITRKWKCRLVAGHRVEENCMDGQEFSRFFIFILQVTTPKCWTVAFDSRYRIHGGGKRLLYPPFASV